MNTNLNFVEMTVTLIIAIITSGALSSFAQFLVIRHDNKKNIQSRLDEIDRKIDENAAVLARTHILRFNDEILNGMIHSREYWRQQLDDCDTYEDFCKAHPDFRNSYTEIADKNIKKTYEKLMREGKL